MSVKSGSVGQLTIVRAVEAMQGSIHVGIAGARVIPFELAEVAIQPIGSEPRNIRMAYRLTLGSSYTTTLPLPPGSFEASPIHHSPMGPRNVFWFDQSTLIDFQVSSSYIIALILLPRE